MTKCNKNGLLLKWFKACQYRNINTVILFCRYCTRPNFVRKPRLLNSVVVVDRVSSWVAWVAWVQKIFV